MTLEMQVQYNPCDLPQMTVVVNKSFTWLLNVGGSKGSDWLGRGSNSVRFLVLTFSQLEFSVQL